LLNDDLNGEAAQGVRPRGAAAVFCAGLAAAAIARSLSIAASLTAVDVVYQETILPSLLGGLGAAMTAVMKGFIYGSVAFAAVYGSKKHIANTSLLGAVLLLLYFGSAYTADLILKAVAGYELLALISVSMNFIYEAVVLTVSAVVSAFIARRRSAVFIASGSALSDMRPSKTPGLCILLAAAIPAAASLSYTLYNVIAFFVRYGTSVKASELFSITSDILWDILVGGVLVWLCACAAYAIRKRRSLRLNKFL
jgi:hypothetical protein